MRIRMITLAAGPQGVLLPGKVYDLEQKVGADLCENGYAVTVKQVRETATAGPPEKAVPFEIPGVSRAVVQEMAARGIGPDSIAETPDNVLLKIPGLGKAALEKIRACAVDVGE